jgi:hypothetical protein
VQTTGITAHHSYAGVQELLEPDVFRLGRLPYGVDAAIYDVVQMKRLDFQVDLA